MNSKSEYIRDKEGFVEVEFFDSNGTLEEYVFHPKKHSNAVQFSNKLRKELEEKIEMYSTKKKNGCQIWNGPEQRGNLKLYHMYKAYSVSILVWNFNNPSKRFDIKIEKYSRTCKNKFCIAPDHLIKIPRKQTISKIEIWNKLLKRTKKTSSGCIEWTGPYSGDYGNTKINGKHRTAHKMSYWCNNDIDVIPVEKDGDKLVIRHLCNNTKCIEPSHLELGTQFKNDYEDKIASGTLKRGDTHYNASITEEIAKKIKLSKRKNTESDYQTQKERAEKFGVTLNVVKSIDCCKSWAHLPDRFGKTSSKRKIEARKHRKNAKTKIWTLETFKDAEKRLSLKSTINKENNKFVGTPCREWLGQCEKGYGYISFNGNKIATHILACEIKFQRRRKGKEVARHLCGNKICCEPTHMTFGTYQENAVDTLKHGNCYMAKLTEETVKEIRITQGKDGLTKKDRCEKYNTSYTNLRDIEKGNTWKHV